MRYAGFDIENFDVYKGNFYWFRKVLAVDFRKIFGVNLDKWVGYMIKLFVHSMLY